MRRLFRTCLSTSTSRPFKVLGIQQVAMAGEKNSALVHFWSDILQLGPSNSSIVFTPENIRTEVFNLGKGNASTILNLMMPLDSTAKPNVAKRSLHHIGLWVDNLEQCVEFLKGKGVRFVPEKDGKLIRRGALGWNVAFIHPQSNTEFPVSGSGVLIQLAQAPNSMIHESMQ